MPKGHTNNPNHEVNLKPFSDPEVARAAALKGWENRRKRKEQEEEIKAAQKRDLEAWVEAYPRDELGPRCAAAAQYIAHKIMDGTIADPRALVQALPVLVDIARLESGLHTNATMHASVTMPADAMSRIDGLRQRALMVTGSTEAESSA
jgi:hypothetical protein